MRTPATTRPLSFSPRLSQRHCKGSGVVSAKGFSTPWDLYFILNGQVLRFSLSIISSIWGFDFFKPCFALLIPVHKCFSLGENEDDQSWTLFSDRCQPKTFIPKGNPVLSSPLGLNMINVFYCLHVFQVSNYQGLHPSCHLSSRLLISEPVRELLLPFSVRGLSPGGQPSNFILELPFPPVLYSHLKSLNLGVLTFLYFSQIVF